MFARAEWTIIVAALLVTGEGLEAGQESALPIDVALRASTVPVATRTVAASADGVTVTLVTQNPSRARVEPREGSAIFTNTGNLAALAGCDIVIVDTRRRQPRFETKGVGSNWGPAWSPDGKRLAFYSDRSGQLALWIWDPRRGLRAMGIAVHPAHGWELPVWAPNSETVLLKVPTASAPTASASKPPSPAVRVYSSPMPPDVQASTADPMIEAERADLVEVHVDSRRRRTIAAAESPTWYGYSADGTMIAVSRLTTRDQRGLVSDLSIIVQSSQRREAVANGVRLGFPATSVSWSPVANHLAFIGQVGPDVDLWVTAFDATGLRRLSTDRSDVRIDRGFRPPVWSRDGQTVFAVAQTIRSSDTIVAGDIKTGKSGVFRMSGERHAVAMFALPDQTARSLASPLFVRYFDSRSKTTGVLWIEPRSGVSETVFDENTAFAGYGMLAQASLTMDVPARGSKLFYNAERAMHGPMLVEASLPTGGRETLLAINPELAPYDFGETRLIDYRSSSGRPLKAALLLPSRYQPGRKYPLVVHLYSARGSDNLNRFGLISAGIGNMQLFATRGFAVLFPDTTDDPTDPAGTLQDSIPEAVRRVVELGIANPAAIGLMGHSYGAYSTVLLLTRTKLFAAAVARGGYYNTFSQYGRLGRDGSSMWTSILEGGIGRGRDPWSEREQFLTQGPVFQLDRIATPLLLIHGGADDAAGSTQSEELFVGLRRLGKTVEYARYEGEEHYEGRWSFPSQRDYVTRMIGWFERYLTGRE